MANGKKFGGFCPDPGKSVKLLKIQFLSRTSREWCIKTLNLAIYACFDKEFDFCEYVIKRKLIKIPPLFL